MWGSKNVTGGSFSNVIPFKGFPDIRAHKRSVFEV